MMAADLSQRWGWISEHDVDRISNLFVRARLPVIAPDLGVEKYLNYMGHDKKVEGGKLRFVLLKSMGEAELVSNVPSELLLQTLEACVVQGKHE